MRPSDTPPTAHLPTLAAALWLYLAALTLTAVFQIGLQANVEIVFLRLITAVFFSGGLTWLTARITRVRLGAVLGGIPSIGQVFAAALIGVLVWLPSTWLILAANTLLNTLIGLLPPPGLVAEGALPVGVAIQLGVVIPICQGIMFWGFLQRAGRGLGESGAMLLTGGLFALFGLVATEFGYSAVPGLLLVGVLAGSVTLYTRSAWGGVAVAGAYGAIRPLIERTTLETALFNFLGTTPEALFGGRWLLLAGLGAFLAFLILQFMRGGRVTGATEPSQPTKKVQRARQAEKTVTPDAGLGRLWVIPLTLSLAMCLLIGYGEWAVRQQNPTDVPLPSGSGSTAVPRR